MIFVYKKWDKFCRDLRDNGVVSISAKDVICNMESFCVLKHDVENKVLKACKLAEIEHLYGHRGTYYIQAYLLRNKKNVKLLKKMQNMGHEISYHYDVMDSNHGNIDAAICEFEKNRMLFEGLGFPVITVCQHGNPIIERVGYTSNRDFFRSSKVKELYSDVADIMVDYKQKYHTDYRYYSDAGMQFKLIYDPINNDRINSDDKNVPYEDLKELSATLLSGSKAIISTHPHRWTKSVIMYVFKEKLFKLIKMCAKMLIHIPVCKKIMSRYYYLAKKI